MASVGAPHDLSDVDFAIVRASFTAAETLLSDTDLRVNAVADLAQHLVAPLDPADIVINLHHAYRRHEFGDKHYAGFHTGPSATADIEGVLIHGPKACARSLSFRLRAVRRNENITTSRNTVRDVTSLGMIVDDRCAFGCASMPRYRMISRS
jgi:hypothetical protein